MRPSGSSQKSKENSDNSNKYFDELRNESFNSTFSATEEWLRSINTNLSTKKHERKYNNMKSFFAANKFKLAYTFLILAFLIAACNYPVTQQETAGDVLKWSVNKENSDAISKIESLSWLKSGQYNFKEESLNGKAVLSYNFIVPPESHNKISGFRKELEIISGINDIKLTPLNETIKRPVYSAVLNDLFKININATNMSDQDLTQEVTSQLKSAGIENAQISFDKKGDGVRFIRVSVPDPAPTKEGGFDMTIRDGNNVNRLKEVRKNAADGSVDRFNGKTDSEIRKMVKDDLQIPDLKDDEIEITRKDGKVMVKVNKTDGNQKEKVEIETK